jgi:peptidoglycan/xylan/chitin deacetylase (PgdA/CDA1 family)
MTSQARRRRWLIEVIVGLAMIPLTAVPIWLYVTRTDDGYLMYLRGRYALAAPGTPGLEDEQLRRALEARKRLRDIHGVPVLVYHGIGKIGADSSDGRFVLTRERFAEQMASLRAAGYGPVTADQLALYLSADPASADIPEHEVLGLPEKPILITFDDGRADAMIQADPILEDTAMRATMFVIGKPTESGSFYYESAERLRGYAGSGRWDLQTHTYALHDRIETPQETVSALVVPEPGESLQAFARRIASDLDRNQTLLERLTGRQPVAFAYPFGDWGEKAPRGVAEAVRQVLDSRVELAFDQDGQEVWRPVLPGDDGLRLHRLEVADWSGAELLARLEAGHARAEVVYDERGLGYRYSDLELATARARTACAEPPAGPVHGRHDLAGERLVALTFNGGPSRYTAQVLDVLARYDAAATFFVRGSKVPGHEALLRRMLVEGNEIANGMLDGVDLTGAAAGEVEDQIDRTTEAIHAATGDDPCLVRPPFGSDSERVATIAAKRGLTTALWSLDPSDYEASSSADVAARVISGVEPGDVIVLHDGGDDRREVTVEALPAIIETLLADGYRLVTVSELLSWEPPEVGCHGCTVPAETDPPPLLVSSTKASGASRSGTAPAWTGATGAVTGGSTGAGSSGSGPGKPGGPGGSGGETDPPAAPPAPGEDSSGPPEPAPDPPGSGTSPPPVASPPAGGGGGAGGSGGGSGGGGGPEGGGSSEGGGGSGGGGGQGGGGGSTSGTPPGHGGTPPGQGGTPPGQDKGNGKDK